MLFENLTPINEKHICDIIHSSIHTLRRLNLQGSPDIMTADMFALLTKCTKLEALSFTSGSFMTEALIMKMRKLNTLRHLKISNFNYCSATPLCEVFLTDSFSVNLKSVNFIGCKSIVDSVVGNLILTAKFLESVTIVNCPITDYGVINVLHFGDNVQNIRLRMLQNIKGDFLTSYENVLSKLRYFEIDEAEFEIIASPEKLQSLARIRNSIRYTRFLMRSQNC